jgi:hypothetical protein
MFNMATLLIEYTELILQFLIADLPNMAHSSSQHDLATALLT